MNRQIPYRILGLLFLIFFYTMHGSPAMAGICAKTDSLGTLSIDSAAIPLLADSVAVGQAVDSVFTEQPVDSVAELPERLPLSLRRRNGIVADTATVAYADSLCRAVGDTLKLARFNDWKPDPIRAMWLGMVFPGGGQIYNRKYWKLPIVYGGVIGCVYALSWNGQMLRDYAQAYQDITDNDPTTVSYLEMLPMGYDITGREEHFKSVFRRKKNFYRRYRDLSIFFMAGVYVLSILDAYVDAELSTFDIGRDLSLSISPNMICTDGVAGPGILGGSPGVTFQIYY